MILVEAILGQLENISVVISIISVCVVIYGAVIAFFKFVQNEFMRVRGHYTIHELRVLRADLGTYLLFGLELLIASDIIKTIIEPGTQELVILGGIVVLRTVLSFFLDREIRLIDQEARDFPCEPKC